MIPSVKEVWHPSRQCLHANPKNALTADLKNHYITGASLI